MTLGETQLKVLEDYTNNIYHAHCSLRNLQTKVQRLFLCRLGIATVDGLYCMPKSRKNSLSLFSTVRKGKYQ
jgi:hypothetical protein